MTRPKQFNGEVLIRFSPIVAWKFQINLVGSFSFIVFSIYKMIENQPSRLTAANIWIETWLGKNIQTFGRSKDKHMFQQMELCTKMSHLLKTNAFSLKTYALKILYLLVSSHLLCVWHHICTIVLYFENSISNLTFILLWSIIQFAGVFSSNILIWMDEKGSQQT